MQTPFVSVKVWGDQACFTRPELKVERLSYPVMTPSAARGVLDAILWKPQMRWHVRRITVLHPPSGIVDPDRPLYSTMPVRRNEIQEKISPRVVAKWAVDASQFEPCYVDSAGRGGVGGQVRTQRNTLLLRDVCYRIDASPILTDKANRPRTKPADEDEPEGKDSEIKYVAMFQRRVEKGQCFQRPYLGCREMVCQFGPLDGKESPIDRDLDLGLMLYDLRFGENGRQTPGFFDAKVRSGILHCDTLAPGPHREAPIQVLGWQEIEKEVSR
jgi:CRISPR-associated protein Cas5d